MKRKALATLCAAVMMVGAVSAMRPVAVKAAPSPLASYDFEDGFGDMTPAANGETAAPTIVTDEVKGGTVQLEFGANQTESYTSFANPFAGKELSAATFMAWVKVPEGATAYEWDNLISFTNGSARLTLQTQPYVCWNANADENWIDAKGALVFGNRLGTWVHYAVVITAEGPAIFINGEQVAITETANGTGYDSASILTFLAAEDTQAYLGFGSFWGSQSALLDDVAFFDAALTADEIKEAANIEAILATQPTIITKVDLNTVTAAVPEDYAAYFAFDGDLKDAVSGESGNTVGYYYNIEADSAEASFEEGMNGQAVAFYGFGDGVKLPVAPSGSQYTISVDWYLKGVSQFGTGIFMANLYEDGTIKGSDEDAEWISLAPLGWQEVIENGPMVWSRNVAGGAAWNDLVAAGNNSLSLEKWTNITLVADGATATIYIDATPIVTGPIADIVNETTAMYLGVNAWDAVFNGYMDNLYIYNRALSADEVAGLAKASLTPDPIDMDAIEPAVAEGYSSYYSFDGNLTDEVTGLTGNTVGYYYNIEADSADPSFEAGISGQAVAFYGFGDGVKLPTAPKGSQYTISVDWYLKGVSQYGTGIFMTNLYEDGTLKGSDEDAEWISIAPLGWQADITSGPMVWSRNVPGGAAWNDLVLADNNSIELNKWFNLTVVADGAVGTIYIDGLAVVTGPIADIVNETTALYLGVNAWDAVFNGYMDNLYIYDRVLSNVEVAALAKASLTATAAPEVTDTPEVTDEPEATDTPEATATEAPEAIATEAPANTEAPVSADAEESSNTGLIVGIVIAVVVVAAVVVVVVSNKKKASK